MRKIILTLAFLPLLVLNIVPMNYVVENAQLVGIEASERTASSSSFDTIGENEAEKKTDVEKKAFPSTSHKYGLKTMLFGHALHDQSEPEIVQHDIPYEPPII